MRVSTLLQLAAFPLALALPTILYLLGYKIEPILYLTLYPWLVGIAAALWDYAVWRRRL